VSGAIKLGGFLSTKRKSKNKKRAVIKMFVSVVTGVCCESETEEEEEYFFTSPELDHLTVNS